MFEIISALIPFFLLGIVAAGLSRVSGVALSMIIVPTLLIRGAPAILQPTLHRLRVLQSLWLALY